MPATATMNTDDRDLAEQRREALVPGYSPPSIARGARVDSQDDYHAVMVRGRPRQRTSCI